MATADWLRTFVAIYRTGSVTDGAALRNLSQPAASQQLASLERSVGTPLFVRTPHGVDPTRHGRELYVEVADALDRLEPVLGGLDGGTALPRSPSLRFGSSPEFFSYGVIPRLEPGSPALSVRFGSDAELLGLLHGGELDVAVTTTGPVRRMLAPVALGVTGFVLVASPALQPPIRAGDPVELGQALVGMPWVAFSAELPRTRRFWQTSLGRPFAGEIRLVAPDLRAVAGAVTRGLGVSLLPEYACAAGLASGALVDLFPVDDLVPSEPWFAVARVADLARTQVTGFVAGLGVPRGT
ncbi:MAG: LysR family transcriptional regulator [Acidimicrobiales bacterium]|jgi:DNA-binding transcriptional LysR family regulator